MKIINICLALIFITIANIANANQVIKLRADHWCPYNCDPGSENPGFLIEVSEYILEQNGYQLDYQLLDWSKAKDEAESGYINGIIGAYKNDAKDFIFHDIPLAVSIQNFYTQKDNKWSYQNILSLNNKRIGIIAGYTYGNQLDQYIDKNIVDEKLIFVAVGNEELEINIAELMDSKIDAFIIDQSVLKNYMKNDVRANLISEAGLANQASVYIAFAPNNPDSKKLAQIMDDGIKEMHDSGLLKKIADKYGIMQFSPNN